MRCDKCGLLTWAWNLNHLRSRRLCADVPGCWKRLHRGFSPAVGTKATQTEKGRGGSLLVVTPTAGPNP
jgi:hypothetical protein